MGGCGIAADCAAPAASGWAPAGSPGRGTALVYRLDKLQKSTGLDLRVFEDAITFKIALMVVKYMKYMETFEY